MDGGILENIEKLNKIYKNKKILDEISLEIHKNDCIGILGENGVGKTTLLKCIANIVIPDSGTVNINNVSAVLEGNRNIYWRLTLKENVEYFLSLKNVRLKDVLKSFEEYINIFNLKNYVNKQVRFLSRGTQQKISIIIALMQKPELLILDEPTLGLDVLSKQDLIDVIRKLNMTTDINILISSHDLDFIEELCNRAFILQEGKLFEIQKRSTLKESTNTFSVYLSEEDLKRNFEDIDILKIDHNKIDIYYINQKSVLDTLNKIDNHGCTIKKVIINNDNLNNIYKQIIMERGQ